MTVCTHQLWGQRTLSSSRAPESVPYRAVPCLLVFYFVEPIALRQLFHRQRLHGVDERKAASRVVSMIVAVFGVILSVKSARVAVSIAASGLKANLVAHIPGTKRRIPVGRKRRERLPVAVS